MAFLFDNLTAFLVGAVLLVGLLFIQQRGQQSAVGATIRYQTEVQAASFVETLSRDLENARTKEQAKAAFGQYARVTASGPREYALELKGTASQTDWLQFVTLANPAAGSASPLVAVAYKMKPTGKTARANGAVRPVYKIERYVYSGSGGWQAQGGSAATVVGFLVRAEPGGTNGIIETLPPRIGFTVEMAFETPDQQAGDQAETAEVGLTRQGATVRLYAAGTGGSALPPSQTSAGIPTTDWVTGYTPPPAPPAAPTGPKPPVSQHNTNSPTASGTPTTSGTPTPSAPAPVIVRPSGRGGV